MTGPAYILYEDIPLDKLGDREPKPPTWQDIFNLFGGEHRFMRRILTRRAYWRWRGKRRNG